MAFLDEECRMKDDDNVHPPPASTHSESARLLPRGMTDTSFLRRLFGRGLRERIFLFPHRTTSWLRAGIIA